jgi:hypothetical protein
MAFPDPHLSSNEQEAEGWVKERASAGCGRSSVPG